jgi:hypothetical protein
VVEKVTEPPAPPVALAVAVVLPSTPTLDASAETGFSVIPFSVK